MLMMAPTARLPVFAAWAQWKIRRVASDAAKEFKLMQGRTRGNSGTGPETVGGSLD